MCGRFSLTTPPEILAEHFGLAEVPDLDPRYNIAPTQDVPVVRSGPDGEDRRLDLVRWGLMPAGTREPSGGGPLINARSESVMYKRSFRTAFRAQRCLVLADGFFEWKRVDGRKQPIYFMLRDRRPFGFAALWDQWRASDGSLVESCVILTTEANGLVRPVHDRMPVILRPDAHHTWLGAVADPDRDLIPLLQPLSDDEMRCHPVNPLVNDVANDTAECVAPFRHETQQDLFA